MSEEPLARVYPRCRFVGCYKAATVFWHEHAYCTIHAASAGWLAKWKRRYFAWAPCPDENDLSAMRQIAEGESEKMVLEYAQEIVPSAQQDGIEVLSEIYRDDAGVPLDVLLGSEYKIVIRDCL